MAKSKPKIPVKPIPYTPPVSAEMKKEKENGIIYTLKEQWFCPGYLKPLEPGTRFIECNDGWYQVYNSIGLKMCYKVGPVIIKEIFGAEAVATI